MQYRRLGSTDLQVSVLGYGASPLGGAFGVIDEEEGVRSVRAALNLGINLFDTSAYYGSGRSEELLGRALRGVPRDNFVLSTKCGRYGPERFDFSADRLTRSLDESLARLGLEYADILLCHDIEFVPLQPIIDEAIPALRRLQQSGKARYIGVSGFPLNIFSTVLAQIHPDVILSYGRYNIYDRSLTELLPSLAERGIGVINASPLGMGLLTENASLPAWHPAPSGLRDVCSRAAAFCRERGVDISQLALQFVVQNEAIGATLAGMPTVELVQKNVAACEAEPDPQLLDEVETILAPVSGLTWQSGLPENNDEGRRYR